MKKYLINIRNNLALLALLFLPLQSLFAHTITFQRKGFSSVAETLMSEHKKNKAMYRIPLHDVSSYLPDGHNIKREALKHIARRHVPGKSFLMALRYFVFDSKNEILSDNAKHFFSEFQENTPHTYVVLNDRLIFTESACNPMLESLKDKFTKHYIISGLQKQVNYSGEFFVFKNKVNGEIFVVFDNSSGTYKPATKLLNNLKQLLDHNFNLESEGPEQKVYFVTKAFDQIIDKNKLFAHEAEPFI